MMEVSILVRCFDRNPFTEQTLASIRTTTSSRYQLICEPNRASAAINSNRLIERASCDRIILLDDDIAFLEPGWDERLLDTLETYSNIGCVGPRLADIEGRLLGPSRFVRSGCVVTGFELWGAVLAFRRSELRYDEAYERTLCDDTDFLLQHLKKGQLLASDGAVDAIHLREASREREPAWLAGNLRYFKDKWQLHDRSIDWGEYTEWQSSNECTVGFPKMWLASSEATAVPEQNASR